MIAGRESLVGNAHTPAHTHTHIYKHTPLAQLLNQPESGVRESRDWLESGEKVR